MEVIKNPYGHVSFGDSDLNPEIPWVNPARDVPPSTDDSENNTTDTDNKKGDRNEPSKNWRWRMAVSLR